MSTEIKWTVCTWTGPCDVDPTMSKNENNSTLPYTIMLSAGGLQRPPQAVRHNNAVVVCCGKSGLSSTMKPINDNIKLTG